MRRRFIILIFTLVLVLAARELGLFSSATTPTDQPAARTGEVLQDAFERRASGLQVRGEGEVARILADDNEGSRHQRFILELSTGQTVLIAHNIDLADRIDGLKRGDRVAFHGEYEWNPQGGVVHWTHHDPQGRHPGGWLEHRGIRYE